MQLVIVSNGRSYVYYIEILWRSEMTFDEAIEILANSENNKLVKDGQLEYGLYRAYDVVSVLQNLRKEYAPIVEMTKRQYHSFKSWKYHTAGWNMTNCAEFARDENMKATDAMTAWLHPETIKIVDE